jgi:hypothetical protein
MSIARWTGLIPGWYRGVGSVNGFKTVFEGIGQVDPPNLGEEGLDRRSIDTGFHGNLFRVTENTRATLTTDTGSTWTLFDPTGSNPIRYTTNFTLAADEVALVQYRILLTSKLSETGAARWGIGPSTSFRTRLLWDDLTTTHIGGYARRANAVGLGQAHGSMDSFTVIPGPCTVDYVRVEYLLQLDGAVTDAGISPARTLLIGTRYRRVQ